MSTTETQTSWFVLPVGEVDGEAGEAGAVTQRPKYIAETTGIEGHTSQLHSVRLSDLPEERQMFISRVYGTEAGFAALRSKSDTYAVGPLDDIPPGEVAGWLNRATGRGSNGEHGPPLTASEWEDHFQIIDQSILSASD
jgi:hypothetical protein